MRTKPVNRRIFLASATALLAAPKLLLAGASMVDYTPGLIKEKLAAGETVFVDYSATWCGTCKRQARILSELRSTNPNFDKHISFIKVDWDTYGSHEVTTSRNVPRRSTLVLLKGEDELGRIVAGTDSDAIQALLELGLAES